MRRSKRKRGRWRLLAVSASMLFMAVSLQGIAAQKCGTTGVTAAMVTAAEPENTDQPEVVRQESEPQAAAPDETPGAIRSRDWGMEDSEILLKVAMAEAEGESTEGKALVMLVVLNRVWDGGFPGTIHDVVFEEGQFSITEPGGRYFTTEPNEDCRKALEMVENGWDESQGALYFEATSNGTDTWHSRNLEWLFCEGGHNFYK